MNIFEAALVLNGREYRDEMPEGFEEKLKEAGLIAIYGYSDDLMQFSGCISDEAGAGTVHLAQGSIPQSECDEGDDCPYFKALIKNFPVVKAIWDEDPEWTWAYETELEHTTFGIFEDGDKFCRGIIIRNSDLPVMPSA
jgi:hypothetical protein